MSETTTSNPTTEKASLSWANSDEANDGMLAQLEAELGADHQIFQNDRGVHHVEFDAAVADLRGQIDNTASQPLDVTAVELDHSSMDIDELILATKREMPPLTEKVMESIRELDATRAIEPYPKVEAIGVIAGIKPAALVSADRSSADNISEIVRIFEGLNLKYILVSPQSYMVSRDERLVEAAALAWNETVETVGDVDDEVQRQLGKLLGYPETATEQFLYRVNRAEQTGQTADAFHSHEGEGEERYFHKFVVSPDHHKSEIDQYAKPLREAVELMAPRTYRAVIERGHEVDRELEAENRFKKIGGGVIMVTYEDQ